MHPPINRPASLCGEANAEAAKIVEDRAKKFKSYSKNKIGTRHWAIQDALKAGEIIEDETHAVLPVK